MTEVHATMTRSQDEVTLSGVFINKFRRAENFKITREIAPANVPVAPQEVIRGDVQDVNGLLYGLAEVAWGLGWRPRSLDLTLMQLVRTFKIPPKQG